MHSVIELLFRNCVREGGRTCIDGGRWFCTVGACLTHAWAAARRRARVLSLPARDFLNAFKDQHVEQHAADVQRLAAIDPQHVKDSDLVTSYRSNRYNIRMCSYSFELLMEFCLERHYLVLLRLMNQFMNIQGQPSGGGRAPKRALQRHRHLHFRGGARAGTEY